MLCDLEKDQSRMCGLCLHPVGRDKEYLEYRWLCPRGDRCIYSGSNVSIEGGPYEGYKRLM